MLFIIDDIDLKDIFEFADIIFLLQYYNYMFETAVFCIPMAGPLL